MEICLTPYVFDSMFCDMLLGNLLSYKGEKFWKYPTSSTTCYVALLLCLHPIKLWLQL
jgi:hypothetical protein